jgi:hypothetical protein
VQSHVCEFHLFSSHKLKKKRIASPLLSCQRKRHCPAGHCLPTSVQRRQSQYAPGMRAKPPGCHTCRCCAARIFQEPAQGGPTCPSRTAGSCRAPGGWRPRPRAVRWPHSAQVVILFAPGFSSMGAGIRSADWVMPMPSPYAGCRRLVLSDRAHALPSVSSGP